MYVPAGLVDNSSVTSTTPLKSGPIYNSAKLIIVAASGACPANFNSLIAADKLGALYPNLLKAAVLSAPLNVLKVSISFSKAPLVPNFNLACESNFLS